MENYIYPFLWMRDQSEETLRTEIAKIDECGIKAVCVESRPHPDFGGEGWWKDMDIIIDEAKKRDMKIWILDDAHFPTGQANGQLPAQHPELARKYVMTQHTDCVGPVAQANLDVELFMTKQFTWMDFGKPVNTPLINENKLISVMAYPVVDGDILAEGAIDLTDTVENGWATFDLPAGVFRICVTFETYDFGARNEYINYVDEKSVRVLIDAIYELHYEHYKDEFGKTIMGFFSDEPGYYNVEGFDMDDAVGRKKMALPWSDEMRSLFEEEGNDWGKKLPLLWYDSEDPAVAAALRKSYMDKVSSLYAKNFSGQLGKWCEDHGVIYVGHVIEDNNEHSKLGCGTGHYFRAMSGQHIAGIDTIGGQILPGNPVASRHLIAYHAEGKFYHYGIAKLGASAAQVDPKKQGRLLCEAFGAYGWNFGTRNIKWLSDFLLVNGVNHFVPHAFSMADYPDDDCPPHFYARGNNPEFKYFAEVMKYVNKMCNLLNGGKNVPVAALLYPAENDWMNDSMTIETPGQVLLENQIDFEIIPADVFEDRAYYGAKFESGKLIVNERSMSAILVPETQMLDEKTAKVLAEAIKAGVKVIFINALPKYIVAKHDGTTDISCLDGAEVVALADIADELVKAGMYDIRLKDATKALSYYHYASAEDIYFMFNNSLSKVIETSVTLSSDATYYAYDCMADELREVASTVVDGKRVVEIALQPYESIVLMTNKAGKSVLPQEAQLALTSELDVSTDWTVSAAKAIDYPTMGAEEKWDKLVPYSTKNFGFSGLIRYKKTVDVPTDAAKVVFAPEHIYEVAEVFVDGVSAGKKVTPNYEWDITELCKNGKVEITVEVANTPTRDILKNPGIFGPAREVLEPSGMFGKIAIKAYN